ncbi:flagellar hook-basal body complex protein FliE [Vibrio campbellii]|jgi:flagellar hook-basal body complex protein FliE|uniref:flagellar hook-basal body complex protein FliE n=1 Tax=Vibrio TaxID=662 RepID=UPI0002AE590D|nr:MULTISPECIES: flagellar hook-basal body complex protein FliE [Vibrio]AQM71353.1 flagellar hook-basal body protein FliE [Vibrio campbellii]ARR46764.1 flagellar hook-basal body complex protein FliE [Vibrio campbellii]ARV75030.1 flagellar hook-basal body complex protein FliE [Vibrio campbellii CAIM 519 = NBRC 15631 = ATCC 25920]AUW05623.1 flagellar hook-basal body complex protein FliE [Vibrio campbellii]ELU51783.1 flagellar hook-basal body protein [Vibrio campbellii CAIM 519 = NBRC 15631 = ATC
MASQPTNAVSAEQLMLSKMEAMRTQVQPPEFVVSANPLDQQSLNAPLSFSQAMTNVLDTVNQHQSVASQKMTAVETGASDDLVGAMIASQKASLSFNALMQVRNKVVMSFEDIMKMPV